LDKKHLTARYQVWLNPRK